MPSITQLVSSRLLDGTLTLGKGSVECLLLGLDPRDKTAKGLGKLQQRIMGDPLPFVLKARELIGSNDAPGVDWELECLVLLGHLAGQEGVEAVLSV
jgi:hypothetical protein